MSQEDLAKLIDKKRPYISRVENGEDIRISNLVIIANALGLIFTVISRIKKAQSLTSYIFHSHYSSLGIRHFRKITYLYFTSFCR